MTQARLLLALAIVALLPVTAAAQTETIEYYGLDHLGSVRVIFNASGQVVDRMDYGPFGENLKAAIKFPVDQFAGLARDSESGQDYAQARNYSTSSGRFNRPDPVFAGLFNPQEWNRYAYAINSPLLLTDATGLLAAGPPNFCGAEFSFGGCGGDRLFWNTNYQYDSLFEFGGGYGRALERGYAPGMPAEVWAGLESFNQRVDDAILDSFLERAETYTIDAVVAQLNPRLLQLAGDAIRRLTPAAQRTFQGLLRLMGRSSEFDRARQALLNAQPVGSALNKDDLYHRAATWMQQSAAVKGTYFRIFDDAHKPVTLIQYAHDLNGIPGRYEYVINATGQLTHQMFVRGGTINGIPIKP